MKVQTILHRQAIIALFLIPFLGWVSFHTPTFKHEQFKSTQIQYTTQFFKLMTVGYWPAAVEGMWISLLQQINQSKISPEVKEELISFYDLATDLDPLFYELYDQSGIYFSFYNEDPIVAEKFLSKGISVYNARISNMNPNFSARYWPSPYSLFIYLAYVQAFQMQDWAKARQTFLAAAEVPRAPGYLMGMKQWLKEEGSEKVLAKKILMTLIRSTQDEVVKQKYQDKLKQIEAGK